MGGGRAQAPRHGRAGRLRDRAEDRRLRDLARLRERRLRARRDARGRHARRGRDARTCARSTAVPLRVRLDDGEAPPALARGARRDLLPALRVRPLQRGAGRGGQEAGAEPAERRGRLAAPARLRASPRSGRCRSGCTASAPARDDFPQTQWEMLAWLREHGFRTNPHAERLETIEEVAEALQRVGDAAGGARLRDRRHRDQGRRPRPAATARRSPRAAALGAGLQVGADRRR